MHTNKDIKITKIRYFYVVLEILYPDMFEQVKKEGKTLYKIAIDDKSFGGIVSNIVCWHEITLKKNFGVFHYVKDLKTYLKKIDPISR